MFLKTLFQFTVCYSEFFEVFLKLSRITICSKFYRLPFRKCHPMHWVQLPLTPWLEWLAVGADYLLLFECEFNGSDRGAQCSDVQHDSIYTLPFPRHITRPTRRGSEVSVTIYLCSCIREELTCSGNKFRELTLK
jgi:hypothetical protein